MRRRLQLRFSALLGFKRAGDLPPGLLHLTGEKTKKKTNNNYFTLSNPLPPHSRAYDREQGCVNSSMVFKRLGGYDCSTSFACRALSTCLRADLANSNIGSVNESQALSKKKPDGGLNEVAYSQPKATQKQHPFQASGYTQNTKAPT